MMVLTLGEFMALGVLAFGAVAWAVASLILAFAHRRAARDRRARLEAWGKNLNAPRVDGESDERYQDRLRARSRGGRLRVM